MQYSFPSPIRSLKKKSKQPFHFLLDQNTKSSERKRNKKKLKTAAFPPHTHVQKQVPKKTNKSQNDIKCVTRQSLILPRNHKHLSKPKKKTTILNKKTNKKKITANTKTN